MKFLSLPVEQALEAAVQFYLAGGVVTASEWDALTPEARDILSLARNLPVGPSEADESQALAAVAEALLWTSAKS